VAQDVYQRFQDLLTQSDPISAVEDLIEHFRQQRLHAQLFEVYKMRARLQLGLPLTISGSTEALSESQRNQLEDSLIEACDEVGRLLLDEGRILEGWYYLRAVGDKSPVVQALEKTEINEENIEDLIQVALHEQVAPDVGFRWMLEHYGTCNAVTAYEQIVTGFTPVEQRPLAKLLVNHVYEELTESLLADIQQKEGSAPSAGGVLQLITDRDWLFANSTYHIDTSHLAATVRFVRVSADADDLQKALEMAEYGNRLDAAFHYDQAPPFEELYPSHITYFKTLLGQDVETGLDYFRQKAEACDVRSQGSLAVEIYIELLSRLGHHQQALEKAFDLIPPGIHTIGVAPDMLELSENAGDYSLLAKNSQKEGDLLGYATALLFAKEREKSG